jgi:hypothetical protein
MFPGKKAPRFYVKAKTHFFKSLDLTELMVPGDDTPGAFTGVHTVLRAAGKLRSPAMARLAMQTNPIQKSPMGAIYCTFPERRMLVVCVNLLS